MPYEAAPQPQHGASGCGALGDGFAQQCPGSLFLYLRWVLVSAGQGRDPALSPGLLPTGQAWPCVRREVCGHYRDALCKIEVLQVLT